MKRLVFSLVVVLCLTAACSRPDGTYYELVGGDREVDWIEFLNDSTMRWMGPGPRVIESPFVEKDGLIVVETAPMSSGFLMRMPDGSLRGEAPFFEGNWKVSRKPQN